MTSTRTLLLGILRHLSRRRRCQLATLVLVMLASGLAEVFSLAAVLPFLAVLTEPQRLWQVPLVQGWARGVGIEQASGLLVPATLLFAMAAVLATAVRLTNLWLNGRLAAAIGSDLSCEAYRRTLHQPYAVHVRRNSSGVITSTTTQIGQTVWVLNALLQLVTSAVVAAGLLTALLASDWVVACTLAGVFGGAYGLLAAAARRRLAVNSALVSAASRAQLKTLQEGLGAIRDVLLDGNQDTYLTIYRQADRPLRLKEAESTFLGAFPRYTLEALGLVVLAVLALLLTLQRGSSGAVIPLLGTLALGAQRLLQALQMIYASWSSIRARSTAVAEVLAMLDQPLPPEAAVPYKPEGCRQGMAFQRVELRGLCFRYSADGPWVLDGIQLTLQRGERIGIIGSTGSGKSTLLDLVLGLLEPSAGSILVDGASLHDPQHPERLPAWRATLAHVPQSIYLADSSIAENIAFGVPKDQIDGQRVRDAARQAQIAGFIESTPEGYDSFVGERGIRLSGGQRQRLGIARALYKRAQVLVFDEATSALDHDTEAAVMEAINELSRDLTVLMIAHRLSTVERCDRVIRLEQGRVLLDGPPQALLATH